MAVREVLRYPHPSLKRVAAELDAGDPDAERLARDLLDTMEAFAGCVGIAAPQLDELVRMVVVDVTGHRHAPERANGRLVLVNPRVVEESGGEVGREGCLSIPDLTANVRRATRVTVAARTPAGGEVAVDSEGFEARCLLHEIDHLDGVLFLDRVESLTDDVFRRKNYR
jgi:peptide deformylase